MTTYSLSGGRATAALLLGALAGAIITTAAYFAFPPSSVNAAPELAFTAALSPVIIFFAFIAWGAGIIVLGGPCWLILHRLGQRTWPVAMILGAVLVFLVALAATTGFFQLIPPDSLTATAQDETGLTMEAGRLTAHGWIEALKFAALCCLAGAAVGLVVWRVAYRHDQPTIA